MLYSLRVKRCIGHSWGGGGEHLSRVKSRTDKGECENFYRCRCGPVWMSLMPCSCVTSTFAFASNFTNGVYGNKW